MNITHKPWFIPSCVGAVSLGGGFAIGYILGKRQGAVTVVEAEPDCEDTSVQLELDFDGIRTVKDLPTGDQRIVPQEGQVTTITEVTEITVEFDEDDDDDEEAVVVSIFPKDTPEWDYDAEVDSREGKHAYILHIDEFNNDEMDYDNQESLTYYEGDQMLVGEDDIPLYSAHEIIPILRFGHGSGDPNTCYIRNEKLNVEYEVIRDPGTYEHTVLGGKLQEDMEAEDIRHSRYPHKFRMD